MASTSRSAAPCRCGGRAASRGGADGSPRGLDVDCAGDARVEWGARRARRCHSPPEAKRCGTPQHRLLAAKLAYDEGVNGPLRDEREVGPWRVVPVGRHPIGKAARMVYAHGPHTSFSARAGGLPGVGALAMGGVAFSDDPAEVQVAAGVSMHVPGAWEALASGALQGHRGSPVQRRHQGHQGQQSRRMNNPPYTRFDNSSSHLRVHRGMV